jgi:formamidopyrimidine-DNA glycosylase
MPELPDIELYLEHLRTRLLGQPIDAFRLSRPFLLRTVEPPAGSIVGKPVVDVHRMGKRIVFSLEGELFLVLHLMIAGRLRWLATGSAVPGKIGLAALDFPTGTLVITEAGSKRRASLHIVQGRASLGEFARGGLEVLDADLAAFSSALLRENHTLKRTLTDPRLFSGIGNAYSDEILHRARLSPVRLSRQLKPEEIATLYEATRTTLREWIDRLKTETGLKFPEKVTAFRKEMGVHGRYGQPCPVCGDPIQRIRYAENETNYCATCQTGGRLLADRGLSRLLKEDWPRSLDEMDELKTR